MKTSQQGVRIINVSLFFFLLIAVLYWACSMISFAEPKYLYHTGCNEEFSLQPQVISAGSGSISPNTAGFDELMSIPGIGEKTALAIIEERTENGFFYYPEDLLAVQGIGAKKLVKFLQYFSFP